MDQKIIFIGSIREYLELDKKKTKNPDKYKKFEIVYDFTKIRKEVRNMTDQTNDEKRFSKEEKIVEEYLESHPKVEYREAVLTVLNKGELNENEKKVEEYIEKCKSQGIEVTYREAVLNVLDRSEPEPKKEE